MPLPSSAPLLTADVPDPLPWYRLARLLAAAAMVGAIIGGMG
ncbi:hypothetical protein TBR22_A26390 [Luteitalea sp. TBR-22]|nr:hypothetical protein [Luteitalea sp. TBR-22]BCS33412.1 hypothetical protein TBR22_A26390 [Luteitalea sp. TBR-22]